MSTFKSDPLLGIAGVILWFILGVLIFAIVIVAICIPAVLIFGGEFVEASDLPPLTMNLKLLIALLLAGVTGMLYLAWRFFRAMQAILRSVGEGDPFIPANASRLTAMAWIMLAINVVSMPLAALGMYIADMAGEADVHTEAGFDAGGVVLILTLFILARVFRKGTEMREDLEGTV
jgi:Protein of unknown function (DUF2975)